MPGYDDRGIDSDPHEEPGAGRIVGTALLMPRGVPASGKGDLTTCVEEVSR